ncbi:hypothetical protein [Gryllotalpicola ginsengisoli]|uniref:hypothetical protein n=1 Tax=Gryllotalpicola ginsengisoli TaxID=444608 RepID=UPI0003B4CB61|nr:hypothetical protein [Gryllotalpicola ginsengisoli]
MTASDLPTPLTELLEAHPIETDAPARRRRTKSVAPAAPEAPERKPRAPKPAKPAKGPRLTLTRAARADDLVIGGTPRAFLLPPEVAAVGKARQARNLVLLVLVAVVLLAGGATAGTYVLAQRAQSELAEVQSENASVVAQQARYASVRSVQSQVALAQSAQRVGAATEIDWKAYFAKIDGVLPSGVQVTAISGETASPTASVSQDAAPLSPSRAATVTLTVSASSETAIADALDAMQKLPGYADAVAGAITSGSAGAAAGTQATGDASTATASGSWTTTITLSLTDQAFSGRFAGKQ